jgi:hypothetical protein
MDASYQPDPGVFSSVLLAERLVFGFLFAAHGPQQLFGWFRGAGLDNTGGFFEQLGLDAALGLRIGRPGSSGRYWLGARSLDSRTCSPCASACRLGRNSAVRRRPGSDMIPSSNVRLVEIVED